MGFVAGGDLSVSSLVTWYVCALLPPPPPPKLSQMASKEDIMHIGVFRGSTLHLKIILPGAKAFIV